ncbi:fam-f protein [Plasmodium relictum]|uniref:Fam-f protein n=1 Tax=Plasmodium relictum TaxID=85471 RepID=A0A1J1GJZ5_PLARL|nr:fam-f protein [Plasmodium relictum]CRG84265.1 fam-f protein [Plasmodium relictum]
MRSLLLICYFYFLYITAISIGFYNIDVYYNSNRLNLKFVKYKEIIQLIRKLAEVFDIKNEDILNDSGHNIKEVQLLYNLSETKYENTPLEGYFGDSRDLFVKLVDLIFLENFNEKLKQEKNKINSICCTLNVMENKIKNYMDSSVDSAGNHISFVFKDLASYEDELRIYTDVGVEINFSKNNQILIDKQRVDNYFKDAHLSKINLRLGKSFNFFNKLYKMNKKFLSEFNRDLYHYDLYTTRYIGMSAKMFPLKYAHLGNLDLVNFDNRLRDIFNEFHRAIFNKDKKNGVNETTSLKVNTGRLNFLIYDMYKTLYDTIAKNTHKLFLRLNKILNGDIKCLIAFILYILEQDICKNKFILDELKDKHGTEVFRDKFLFHIYELLLQEKEEIKKSLNVFKTYIKEIFGFDVNSSGISSLVQKLYELDNEDLFRLVHLNKEDGYIPLFKAIVYSLGCLRKLNEFSNFLKLLKNESKSKLSVKLENILMRKSVLYIPKDKSRDLILKFLDIYESSIYFIELKESNSRLVHESISIDCSLKNFRAFNYLISLLIKELNKLKKSHLYSKKKIKNKYSIIFFLYEIKEFNGSCQKHRFIRYI